MDVLEVGDHARPPRRANGIARTIAAVVVLALAAGIIVAAGQWWSERSARPDRAEIIELAPSGPFGVSGADLPADWPRGIVVGAMTLRAQVAGDPQRTMQVRAAGDGETYFSVAPESTAVPAGEVASLDVVVSPADCSALVGESTAPISSPLMDSSGAPVPLQDQARDSLEDSLRSLCAPGGDVPVLMAEDVRVDVFFRDRTLVMRVRMPIEGAQTNSAGTPDAPDRVVLQPLDSIGFRGGSEQDATIEGGAATSRLRWLISPAEAEGLAAPTVRVRVFAITSGRAYPWVLDLRVPAELETMSST